MSRWHIHKLDKSLASHTIAWDEANRRFMAGHPMLDSRFIEALLRHYGDGQEYLCRQENSGGPGSVCILKRAKRGIWESFRPSATQLGAVILANAAGLDDLPRHLPGLAGEVDLLCQDPDYSPLFNAKGLSTRPMSHALTMSIRLSGDFDAYWQSRSHHLCGFLRKRDKFLDKAGLEPRLIRLDKPEDMAGAIKRFGELECAGWKGRAGSAVSADNHQGRFYRDLLTGFAQTGQAAVYEYWLGNQHAATELTIASDRAILLLKTTYNEALGKFSPGRMILREVIREAFTRQPGGVIEFYTNAKPDDLEWATDQRWIEHVSVYRNLLVCQCIKLLKGARSMATHLGTAMPMPIRTVR